VNRPVLRVPLHRGTTAHVSSIYPFSVQGSFGHRGVYVGIDLLAGGGEFCWDPFDAYDQGQVTNPNCWILGEPGNGKSALVKSVDPKGEYTNLAARLGLTVLRLEPGGTARINPLTPGPAARHEPPDRQALRQGQLCAALVATVLDRSLTQAEDAALFAAVEHLLGRRGEPTLGDVAGLLRAPTADMADRAHHSADAIAADAAAVGFALDKLLSRSLRGMFDGPSTMRLDWEGPGIVLDLSAVPLDSEALPLVMVATAGWLQQLMACPGPQRLQVLDEAWALLGNRHTATYLQSCFKLGRTYGVANLCITHRASDLTAQADDGSATSKIAAGLLADSATKIVLRQAPDQVPAAVAHFGLTEPEARIIGALTRGRALWRIGGRTALVHHLLTHREAVDLCDTDQSMRAGTPADELARAA